MTDIAEAYAAHHRRVLRLGYLLTGDRHVAEDLTADVFADASSLVEDDLARRDVLWTALEALPVRQRTVLVLRYDEDLSDEEIADVLGVGRGTVRSSAARGLARLRVGLSGAEAGLLRAA